jgi:sugar phosphate permease
MKIKIFYGWYIVAAGLIMAAYYSTLYVYGFTAFVNPIVTTFGWSMTQLSLASSLRGLETGVFNPLWGTVVDRWSPRKLMLFGVIITAAGMFTLSRTTNLAMYYAGFLIDGVGSSLVTGLLPVVAMAKWFKRDMGKANGLFYMGVGLGGVMVPVVVMLIDKLGWRDTLMYGGVGFLVIGIPLSFIFRSKPEEYSMMPDGRTMPLTERVKQNFNYDFGTRIKEALKMRSFWHLNIVILFQTAVLGIMSLFAIPYFQSIGISRNDGSLIISLFTIVSLCGRIPMGLLSDIIRKKYVMTVTLGLLGIGLFLLWLITDTTPFWMTVLFAICYGLGISGIMPLRAPVMVEYFGNRNIGAILGITSIFVTIAGVTAVPLTGRIFDSYHTYKPMWIALVVFAAVAVILMLAIPAPGRKDQIAAGETVEEKQVS